MKSEPEKIQETMKTPKCENKIKLKKVSIHKAPKIKQQMINNMVFKNII